MGIAIPNDLTGESVVRFGGTEERPDGLKREVVPETNPGIGQDDAPFNQSIPTQDDFPNTTPAGVEETDANIVHSLNPEQCRIYAESMDSEQLAEHVVKNGWGEMLVKLKQLKPYIEILWIRFEVLKGTETIAGCRTKSEFCDKCLNRSARAVQYMLYGRGEKKRAPLTPVVVTDIDFDSDGNIIPFAEALDGATPEEPSLLEFAQGPNHVANQDAERGAKSSDPGGDEKGDERKVSGSATDQPLPHPAVDPVPDPDPSTMEALRQLVRLMVDTDEINTELEKFFTLLTARLLEHHPCVISSSVRVNVELKGHSRLDVGDWVVSSGQDCLKKLAVEGKALGRLVGRNQAGYLKVRWHTGETWTRPYKLMGDFAVRVLSNLQAAAEFPRAYSSYPSDNEDAPGAAPNETGAQSVAGQDTQKPAAVPTPKPANMKKSSKPREPIEVTEHPPHHSPAEENPGREASHATPGHRQGSFVLQENGKYEYEPEDEMREEVPNAQHSDQQLPPTEPMAPDPKQFRVKKRIQGDIIHFLVIRDGDKLPDELFNDEINAEAHCEQLNKSLAAARVAQEPNL